MKKRLVSILLALLMCMGLVVPAFAAEVYDIKDIATEVDLTS